MTLLKILLGVFFMENELKKFLGAFLIIVLGVAFWTPVKEQLAGANFTASGDTASTDLNIFGYIIQLLYIVGVMLAVVKALGIKMGK